MGQRLKTKHVGESTGMIRPKYEDKEETRVYHREKAANKDMAKAFANMVLGGAGTENSKVVHNPPNPHPNF